ncbi:hypothetical protein F511_42757 [Dorcoceras hygrometricum]|uniref:Uncharacterized protein n=1 Tax=Dorcoceras hygrometricum TaxID=472368 RepID=A0A2Z7CEC7_9LAMI|nr:hypothetical protein F511_42757 [Dorcoceras hygrometricum]
MVTGRRSGRSGTEKEVTDAKIRVIKKAVVAQHFCIGERPFCCKTAASPTLKPNKCESSQAATANVLRNKPFHLSS